MVKDIDKIICIKVKGSNKIVNIVKDKNSSELKYNYGIYLEYGTKTELYLTKINDISIE